TSSDSEPPSASGRDGLSGFRGQLAAAYAVEHPLHRGDNVRGSCGQPGLVCFADLIRVDAGASQHGCRVGELTGQPGHRVCRQLGDEVPAARLPTVETWVVMGAIQ